MLSAMSTRCLANPARCNTKCARLDSLIIGATFRLRNLVSKAKSSSVLEAVSTIAITRRHAVATRPRHRHTSRTNACRPQRSRRAMNRPRAAYEVHHAELAWITTLLLQGSAGYAAHQLKCRREEHQAPARRCSRTTPLQGTRRRCRHSSEDIAGYGKTHLLQNDALLQRLRKVRGTGVWHAVGNKGLLQRYRVLCQSLLEVIGTCG